METRPDFGEACADPGWGGAAGLVCALTVSSRVMAQIFGASATRTDARHAAAGVRAKRRLTAALTVATRNMLIRETRNTRHGVTRQTWCTERWRPAPCPTRSQEELSQVRASRQMVVGGASRMSSVAECRGLLARLQQPALALSACDTMAASETRGSQAWTAHRVRCVMRSFRARLWRSVACRRSMFAAAPSRIRGRAFRTL